MDRFAQDEPQMEDEEVVFEGSAIHQHLLDVGYTDFEQSPYLPSSSSQVKTQEDTASSIHEKTGWLERGQQWCTEFPHNVFSTMAKPVQRYIYASVAKAVFSSKLVSEDDWLVLEHFLPNGEELLASGGATFFCWRILTYRDLAVVGVLLLLPWVVLEDWLFHLCLFLTAVIMYAFYCMYLVWKTTSLKQFVISIKETNYLTSKTVRLLQEVDLIAKGFVLAQGPGAALASPYEEPPQVTHLSEALLCTLTSAAKILLSAHKLLEQRVPHYPTIRHLFDEPPPLGGGCTFSERIQYLKSKVTVIKLQTSAVLTELLLWLCRLEGICEYKIVVDVICTLTKKDAFLEKSLSLKQQYQYNRCFWTTERPCTSGSQSVEEKKKNVYVAIHSLALHLQAALVRVQSLEAEFERESDMAKLCDPESLKAFPSYEHTKTQLTALRLELDSCQGCIEEAEVRVERKYGIAENNGMSKATSVNNNDENGCVEVVNTVKPLTVLLYDQEVPPAEDEVFEASIDQEFVDKEKRLCEEELWCADVRKERQVLREQKEQGKRVLRELQPILTSRRKMWEEREEIALKKHSRKVKQGSAIHEVHTEQNERDESSERKESIDESGISRLVNNEELKTWDLKGTASCGSSTPAHSGELTCEHVVEEDVDSDEERLTTYRKIKRELDEDEEKRIANEVRLGEKRSFFGKGMRDFQSIIDSKKESVIGYGDTDSEEETNKAIRFPVLPGDKLLPMTQESYEKFSDNIDEFDSIKDRYGGHNTKDINVNLGNRSTQTKLFCTEVLCSAEEGKIKAPSEEITKQEEEIFVHNEDIDDSETRHIDWTTFTLPIQQTDTLEERLQLYSDGSCLGFQAEVAAKASTASRNFCMAEETFGGVGEGEVFGTDSEQEKSSDSAEEEN